MGTHSFIHDYNIYVYIAKIFGSEGDVGGADVSLAKVSQPLPNKVL